MIIKIAVLGILVCVVSFFLKGFSGETVLLLELAFAVIVTVFLADKLFDVADKLKTFLGESETERLIFSALFKGALICVITKFAADTAIDSGNRLVADIIDFSGRVLLLTIAFPFMQSVIETATAFMP